MRDPWVGSEKEETRVEAAWVRKAVDWDPEGSGQTRASVNKSGSQPRLMTRISFLSTLVCGKSWGMSQKAGLEACVPRHSESQLGRGQRRSRGQG